VALAVVALALVAWTRSALGQLANIQPTLTPLVETSAVPAGSNARLALRVVLPEGLHLQSNAPYEPNYIPTVLWLDTPDGVSGVEVVFPDATDFVQAGVAEPLAVFEHEFVIGVQVAIAAGHAPGEVSVPALFRYQACDDKVCFPPQTMEAAWTFRVAEAAGGTVDASRAEHADVFGGIAWGTGGPLPTEAPPRPRPRPAAGAGAGVGVTASGPAGALARLENFTILGSEGGYMNVATFMEFIDRAESGTPAPGLFENRGLLAVIAITALGGLLLNLTPCVLPMIPINLAIIGAGAQGKNRRRGLMLGAAYGSAMALVYGVLGLVVILTAGTFGTINSSPWFNLAIAGIFVVLALAMFDVVSVDFSRFSSRIRFGEESRGTFLLAFSMGGIAALLAGACVAPVVIQVILFASDLYAGGTTIALALPFFLGLGMALPWPVAGAGMAALPKPGAWMVRVKQAFGVFIMATALYYGYTAYGLFANRWVDPASVAASVEAQLEAGWYADLDRGLGVAERDQTFVLLDLWATWCKNCLTMDKTTLADAGVQGALENYTKIKFQAEYLDEPPASDLMRHLGAIGLPAYAILKPNSMPMPQR
jgi:cytochrome c biogenesis protein CcdA